MNESHMSAKPIATKLILMGLAALCCLTARADEVPPKRQPETQAETCAPAKKFTDQDFDQLKAENPEFVIYFWSPFMPLSVRGREEIDDLAKRNHIPKVVGVLDFSRRVCHKETGIFADPAFDSKELASGHALNHFPTILYVRNSKIEAQIPGYDLPEKFTARIKKIREKDLSK